MTVLIAALLVLNATFCLTNSSNCIEAARDGKHGWVIATLIGAAASFGGMVFCLIKLL